MNNFAKALVLFVVAFHAAIFVVEAFLWMHPAVYEFALNRPAIKTTLDLPGQALVLQASFVNQGFYNLFLASAGIAGLVFLGRGNEPVGYTLIVYMCLSAVGAGLVLATSTPATIGAILQAVPAVLALAAMLQRLLRGSSPSRASSEGNVNR
jgi:putative membrane protein